MGTGSGESIAKVPGREENIPGGKTLVFPSATIVIINKDSVQIFKPHFSAQGAVGGEAGAD